LLKTEIQAGKGAENTKEKSRQCFTFTVRQVLQFLGIFFPKHMKLLTEYSFYKYFSQNDENSSPKKSLLRTWHTKKASKILAQYTSCFATIPIFA
jgi:hypothetical protein